jgi:hypothetical protein
MQTIQKFIQNASLQFQLKGYLLDNMPVIAGTSGLMYACSPRPYPLIFTKVVDHFLFLDWENSLFSRKDNMVEAYQVFNRRVNEKFGVPNLFRITIPNMALIAVSESGFDEETLDYARRTYLVPWKGGEVGQFFLVDLAQKTITYHRAYQRKQYGEAPLRGAQNTLVPMMNECLKDD